MVNGKCSGKSAKNYNANIVWLAIGCLVLCFFALFLKYRNTVLFAALKQNFYLGCPLGSAGGIVIHWQTPLSKGPLCCSL